MGATAMPPRASGLASSQPVRLLLLACLGTLVLFAGLSRLALTDRDEGANAEAAREMVERRSWITPALDYAPRFAKPPLAYWLMAAAYAGVGPSERAARLPSAVAGAALIALQYVFARWALGPGPAFRAALVLLLAIEPVMLARLALTDALLVLWTTAAGFAFFRAHHRDGGEGGDRGDGGDGPGGRWYAAMYLAMALGLLTKGPVGLLVPAAGIAAYLAVAGGGRRLLREGHLVAGLAALAATGGPWYAAMLWQYGGDYAARARGETVGRIFRTVTGPGGTPLFYVPVILLGFFPWSAVLPTALWAALRGARARAAASRAGATAVFAATWVLVVLVAFSLFQSRLPHYVAPAFPAAALLLAAAWPARAPGLARGLLAALGVILGAVLLVSGLAGGLVAGLLDPVYPAAAGASLSSGVLVMAALALAIAATAALRDGERLFRALGWLSVLLILVALHWVLPAFSADFVAPAGELAARIGPALAPCDALVALGPYRPSLVFYARRPVTFLDRREGGQVPIAAFGPGRLFVLAPEARLARLPAGLTALPRLESRGGYVLLASPATAGGCP